MQFSIIRVKHLPKVEVGEMNSVPKFPTLPYMRVTADEVSGQVIRKIDLF